VKRNLLEAEDGKIYDSALNLLSIREYGSQDMREKLLLKGATEEQVAKTISRLKEAGLIDEHRFARAVYQSWLDKKYYGKAHLIGTLTKKLVDKECWPEILEQFTDELEEQHAREAAELFKKKYAKKQFENRKKLWSTAAAFMVNRGFGSQYMDIVLEGFSIDNGY